CADAHSQGPPGVGKRHAGKYRERTLFRQRGGGGSNASPLPTREESLIFSRDTLPQADNVTPATPVCLGTARPDRRIQSRPIPSVVISCYGGAGRRVPFLIS